MKKTISLCLAIFLVLSISLSAAASDTLTATRRTRVLEIADEIKSDLPTASVRVVDDIIHVVVRDRSEIPGINGQANLSSTQTTSVTSSIGGSFRDFDVPWYGYFSFAPSSEVYMSADVVTGALLKMSEPDLCDQIVSMAQAGMTETAIKNFVKANFGIDLTTGAVSVVIGLALWAGGNLDYWSLESARSDTTGKASLVRGTTSDGYYTIYYYSWNNNICETYGGYEATWHEGEYDIDYSDISYD